MPVVPMVWLGQHLHRIGLVFSCQVVQLWANTKAVQSHGAMDALRSLAKSENLDQAEQIEELLNLPVTLWEIAKATLYEQIFHTDYQVRLAVLSSLNTSTTMEAENPVFASYRQATSIPVDAIQKLWTQIFYPRALAALTPGRNDDDDWLSDKIRQSNYGVPLEAGARQKTKKPQSRNPLFRKDGCEKVAIELKLKIESLLESGQFLDRLHLIQEFQNADLSSAATKMSDEEKYSIEVITDIQFIIQFSVDLVEVLQSQSTQKKHTAPAVADLQLFGRFGSSDLYTKAAEPHLQLLELLLSDQSNTTKENLDQQIRNVLDQIATTPSNISRVTHHQPISTMDGKKISTGPLRDFHFYIMKIPYTRNEPEPSNNSPPQLIGTVIVTYANLTIRYL
eukprot:Gregarina_sp_Poly_1__75@NODE_1017_length_5352_cov_48_087228_g709_i0_p2_GENE_NODE_1017_length_5352_cov_48_087228_g709_i0NODE_1017_length_5352_cov_48_087228_g709_i0_p2_ORF_typecomplete_len394_score43_83TTKRSYEDQ/PF10212_9/2_8e02TTKRSYEDQ/PF10212_9/2_4Drf_FH3/PF06367_16/3e03Drf_FH3/PF06367_16/0_35_NODE_1017_length_5352_cov_48_087228_g709_i021763357